MKRLPVFLLALGLVSGLATAPGAVAAPSLGESGLVENLPLEIPEADPGQPTAEISLFRARAAAGPEYIQVPVKNGDPQRISGFTVAALPEGGDPASDALIAGEPEISGDGYTYKLYFSNPPQKDTQFTISVTPIPKESRAGFDLPKTKTSAYTYRAIGSLTIKAGGAAVGSKTLYLQTGGERQTLQLTAEKNPAAQSYAAEVRWQSSNPSVASVDPVTGVVTGNTGGTVTITAAVYDNPNTITASCTVTVVPISGIGLNPSSKTLFTGGTAAETEFDLTATMSGDNGSTELIFVNSSPNQVTMTKKSNNVYHLSASGKQPGTATITVKDAGGFFSASCTVTVVSVNDVSISPGSYTLYTKGPPQSVQLKATVTVSSGSAPAVSWQSSNPAVATVSSAGLASAVSPGSATITATVGGKSSSCAITVKEKIPVASVTVSGTKNLVRTSDKTTVTTQLSAAVKPDDAHLKSVSWAKTGGSGQINISANGLVTATAAGSATFTATADGITSAGYTVTVTDQAVTGMTISSTTWKPARTSTTLSPTTSISATATPANALTSRDIKWSSSNADVCAVSSASTASGANVTLTAKKAGTATITATSASNGSVKATCTVTVSDTAPTGIAISSSSWSPTRTSTSLSPTMSINATVSPTGAINRNINWTSSNANVCAVSSSSSASGANITLTAKAAGTATITAKAAGNSSLSKTCVVTVTDQKVTGITVSAKSVDKGKTVQMSATVTPSTAVNRNITWSLASGNVATINAGGTVTGGTGSNGTVTVKATAADGSGVFGTGTVTVNGCAHALSAGGYGSGAGTSQSPYMVTSQAQLGHVSSHQGSSGKLVYFKQANHIQSAGTYQNADIYYGYYDGNGYTISGIRGTYGVFYNVHYSTITRLGAVGIDLSDSRSEYYVGGIAGSAVSSTISQCWATGRITSHGTFNSCMGGLCGAFSSSTIQDCYSGVSLAADGASANVRSIGGIVGALITPSTIERTYNFTEVNLTNSSGTLYLGGVSGECRDSSGNSSTNFVSNSNYWLQQLYGSPTYAFGQISSYIGAARLEGVSKIDWMLSGFSDSVWQMGTITWYNRSNSPTNVAAPVLKIQKP